MRLWRNLQARLSGCRASTIDPEGITFFCTLDRGHDGDHEAHTCPCAGAGRCVDGPVEVWAV